ncbi:MAG: hypothetical protein ACJ0G8_02755 [Dehalococcoidia bacterium]
MTSFFYILIVSLISGALFGLIFIAHTSLLFVFKEELYSRNNKLFIKLVTYIIIFGFLAINLITYIFVLLAKIILENKKSYWEFNEYHLLIIMFISLIIIVSKILIPKFLRHIIIQMLICSIIFVIIIPNLLISLEVL